jgi:hypothetical protein
MNLKRFTAIVLIVLFFGSGSGWLDHLCDITHLHTFRILALTIASLGGFLIGKVYEEET